MKPEDKSLKQGAELNEEELDAVTGGQGVGFTAMNAVGLHADLNKGAGATKSQRGADPMKANVGGVQTNVLNPTNRENLGKM